MPDPAAGFHGGTQGVLGGRGAIFGHSATNDPENGYIRVYSRRAKRVDRMLTEKIGSPSRLRTSYSSHL
jgi:hypothetical protein